ncbi:uncharacterized protein NECHADRAFT_77716 [Fusarium vanettenii 77-13-4]|uniref:Uncharacterized protein n=1 Tax=Fusarium vanettenii (strain ATCC MYA-4622 / CBS 123669 / FGSC 9596 / NRRL 45880 / 77-13-4) TaxID=660122 RepID=C7YM03_FUSV7|nr:uncharacterized protein NECHADRAFT_77716 [Fusarium vanettenii 77-13-4]EEU47367.1 predicted protein [Fusarium vanettenii 77-13-4]
MALSDAFSEMCFFNRLGEWQGDVHELLRDTIADFDYRECNQPSLTPDNTPGSLVITCLAVNGHTLIWQSACPQTDALLIYVQHRLTLGFTVGEFSSDSELV